MVSKLSFETKGPQEYLERLSIEAVIALLKKVEVKDEIIRKLVIIFDHQERSFSWLDFPFIYLTSLGQHDKVTIHLYTYIAHPSSYSDTFMANKGLKRFKRFSLQDLSIEDRIAVFSSLNGTLLHELKHFIDEDAEKIAEEYKRLHTVVILSGFIIYIPLLVIVFFLSLFVVGFIPFGITFRIITLIVGNVLIGFFSARGIFRGLRSAEYEVDPYEIRARAFEEEYRDVRLFDFPC